MNCIRKDLFFIIFLENTYSIQENNHFHKEGCTFNETTLYYIVYQKINCFKKNINFKRKKRIL